MIFKRYIVAEATRTLSITDTMQPSGLVVSDGLWLGCETIEREGGLCTHTVQLYSGGEREAEEYTIFEIEDLSLDPRFQNRDYVLNYPHLKFYAGTPLRTKRGYNIGSLCVVDASPRILTSEAKKTLGRMGKLVMQHLEMSAERRAFRRNQRMAECLGRFVAGKHGPLHNDDEDDGSASTRGSVQSEELRGEPSRRPAPSSVGSSIGNDPGTLKEIFSRASVLIRDALMTEGVIFLDADKGYHKSSTRRDSTQGREQLERRKRKSAFLGWSSTGWHEQGGEEDEVPVVDDSDSKDKRPGIGVVPSEVAIEHMLELYPQGTILSFDEPSLPVTICMTSGSSPHGNDEDLPSERPPSTSEEDRVIQEVQDFLPDCAAVLFVPLFHASGKPYAASFSWTRDVRRVFTVDELSYMRGFMSSIMAEVARLNTLSADKAKGDFISSISHELRSPLHGVLASTEFLADTALNVFQRSSVDTIQSCGRMLLDTINHVLDFSKLNSLMREQKTQTSHNATGMDEGSQESKQIRPVRGKTTMPALGGVSLIEAIDISAITEQVIESVYAGYEFKGTTLPGYAEPSGASISGAMPPLQRDTGLLSNSSGLTVVHGSSDHAVDAVTVILDIDRRDDWTFVTQPGAVRRILMNIFGENHIYTPDIRASSSDLICIITGNALKYTDSGWIRVHLEAEDLPISESDGGERKSKITFTVSDSGRGISREFLKTKLFTPFSQEDTLASGTGLGMSIVRQIVHLLGGDIEVKSHVGIGTEVIVTLNLEQRQQPSTKDRPTSSVAQNSEAQSPDITRHSTQNDDPEMANHLSLVQQIREYTVGKTICLCGLDPPAVSLPDDDDSPPLARGAAGQDTLALASLRDSLSRYAREWYGMNVTSGTLSATTADILLSNESASDLKNYLKGTSSVLEDRKQRTPLIILCNNVSRYQLHIPPQTADHGNNTIFDFVSKP